MQKGDELAQIISSIRKRDEALSGLVKGLFEDADGMLGKLDKIIGGLEDYRESLKARANAAKAASLDGQVDWNRFMELISSEPSQKTALPDGINDGTHYADVYRGVNGVISRSELKRRFPNYCTDDIARRLVKIGAFEKAGRGKWRKKAQGEAHQPERKDTELQITHTSDTINLPSCLKSGTVLAKIWTDIVNGKTTTRELHNDYGVALSYHLVVLQQKGVIERTGRGEYKTKQDGSSNNGVTASEKLSVRSSLLLYLKENATGKEISYWRILDEMTKKGMSKASVYAELALQKRSGTVAGHRGMARYAVNTDAETKTQAVAASPETSTALAVAEKPVAARSDAICDADELSSYYGADPILDRELSEYQTAAEKLLPEQQSRLNRIVLGMLGKKESVTAAHAEALRPLYEALRKGTDAEKIVSYLESKGHVRTEEMVKYVSGFVAQKPASSTAPLTNVKKLDNYSGLSLNMRDSMTRLKSVIGVSGSIGDRIEKLVLDYLPENPAQTTSSQQGAVAIMANAFKRAANRELDFNNLLAWLEQKEKDPRKIQDYVNEFSEQDNRRRQSGSYWETVCSRNGELGKKMLTLVPLITKYGRFDDALRRFVGHDGDPTAAARLYHVHQIAGFLQRAEQELGSVPQTSCGCFMEMLDGNGDNRVYLSRVVKLIGDKSRLPTREGVAMLEALHNRTSRVKTAVIAEYEQKYVQKVPAYSSTRK